MVTCIKKHDDPKSDDNSCYPFGAGDIAISIIV